MLSVSARTAKKDLGLLIEALAEMPELERMIILARSNGQEDVPEKFERMAAELDPSIDVRINVPRPLVLEAMARASVLIYTLAPGGPMGYPMSIVEAMLCGRRTSARLRPTDPDMVTAPAHHAGDDRMYLLGGCGAPLRCGSSQNRRRQRGSWPSPRMPFGAPHQVKVVVGESVVAKRAEDCIRQVGEHHKAKMADFSR